jgi:hypothetical protein
MRRSLLTLLCLVGVAHAGELVHEDFNGPTLPPGWVAGGRPGCWTVSEGTLQGVCEKTDDHGPSISVPVAMHDGSFSYKVKLDGAGNCLALLDGESAFGGSAHLLRVGLYGGSLILAQDRGTPQSHIEQGAAKKAGKPVTPPTKEQLADPKFYRTERLAITKLTTTKPGDWIKLDVQVKGQDVTVTINDKDKVQAKGTVFDVAKSRLVFLVGQGKKVWIDEVRVAGL